MIKVQCVPLAGQTELDLVDLGTAWRVWQAGEIKDLPDELAAIALTNPNFVEVKEQPSVAAPTVGTTSSFASTPVVAPAADDTHTD